jgi:hypothetical protein
MCVRFFAWHIEVLTEQAAGTDHNGEPYVNPDYPAGTVIATDKSGNKYRYVGFGASPELDSECWPNATKRGIPLYRDYWRHEGHYPGAPYFDAIQAAPKRTIKTMVETAR